MPTFNLKNNVTNMVNSNYHSNNYESSFFDGFYWEDCNYQTYIRISEQGIINNFNNKPTIVVPYFESESENQIGYYMNGSILDSVTLNEENINDWYVLIISAESDCDADSRPPFPFDPEDHCGNNKCEAILGETPDNCADCFGKKTSQKYTLILQEIQPLTDFKTKSSNKPNPNGLDTKKDHYLEYFEPYFAGQYEIFYQYQIVDETDLTNPIMKDGFYINDISKNRFGRDIYKTNHGYSVKEWKDLILTRLKLNKGTPDINRSITNNIETLNVVKSNGGQNVNKIIQKTLCFDFDPDNDEIYTMMYEFDRKGYRIPFDFVDGGKPGFLIPMKARYTHSQDNMWIFAANHEKNNFTWSNGSNIYGPGSKYIDFVDGIEYNGTSTPSWNYDGTVSDYNSEFRIRYVLIPNP